MAEHAAAEEAARRPCGDIDAAERSVQTADGHAIVNQTARGRRSRMIVAKDECRWMTQEDAVLRR